MERVRRALAALSLLVLAASLVSALSPKETTERVSRLVSALTGGPGYRADAMSFWFDPDYAAFLEDVRRRTPEDATIALLVPASPDVYVYQAVNRLAPRRIVERDREGEARYVAAYRSEDAGRGEGVALPHGWLWER